MSDEPTPEQEAAWRADHPAPTALPPLGEARGEVPLHAVPDAPGPDEPQPPQEPPAEPIAPETDVRDFTAFFKELRRGAAEHEAGVELQALVAAVEATGKPGKLTITLTIEPDPTYGVAVGVRDDVSAKIPKPTKPSSLFFMDGSHNLRREDPGQLRIDH